MDDLAGGTNLIVAFDCEFWHARLKPGYIGVPHTDRFFMPREMGGVVLQRDGTHWKHTSFFVTFRPPSSLDIAFPIKNVSTVTAKTRAVLDDLENALSWGEAYESTLSPAERKIYSTAIKAYTQDPIIREYNKPASWFKQFLSFCKNATVVIKGVGDITSLKNACTYNGYTYTPPHHIVDVARWNALSTKECHTAKLAETYECIRSSLDPATRALAKKLLIGNAHNPLTDAVMTLILALYYKQ